MRKANKYYTLAILLSAAYALSGCQGKDTITPDGSCLNAPLTFNAELNGSSESGSVEIECVKSAELVSSDGSVNIPLSWAVSEGIDAAESVIEGEAITKGEQINPGKNKELLANYIGKVGNTFNIVAFNEGDGNLFIPATSEGISFACVEYQLGDWKISGGREYWWSDEDRKIFYAYANLPETGASVGYTGASGETLSYTVPADARAQKDILLGYYRGKPVYDENKKKGGIADITFYHPMTAVKFVKDEFTSLADMKIKSISISNTHKEGEAALTPESARKKSVGDKFVWTPGAGHQTVTLSPKNGEAYLEVDATTGVIGGADGTFLLIPQSLEDNPVRITVVAEIDGVEHALNAPFAEGQWKAGFTNTYAIDLDMSVYNLSVEGETETEYNGGDGTYTVTSSAPWKLQYKLGDSDWTDAVAGEPIVAGEEFVKFDVVSGGASVAPVAVTATVSGATKVGKVRVSHITNLTSREPRGTKSRPWDLSMHDIAGHTNGTGKATTANSYVVSAPGWYAFPLVYGNAVKNGKLNKAAYHNTGGNLNNLIKADGAAIPENAPYVEGATRVQICWEEADLITNTSDCIFLVPQYEASNYGLTGCDCDYVVFRTNMDYLTQGNALIVVSSASSELWSWHIWVTDADLTPIRVKNSNGSFDGNMMPLNLGWIDKKAISEYPGYPQQAINIRFVQLRGSKVMKEVVKTIIRKEYVTDKSYVPEGYSPTYQWGRKDPIYNAHFLGWNNYANKDKGTLQSSIYYPHHVFCGASSSSSSSGSWLSTVYYNLWSGNDLTSNTAQYGYSSAPVKTVYDPCPPGYQIPQSNAFTGFSASNGTWENNGYAFPTGYDESIFFPAAGYRECVISSGNAKFNFADTNRTGVYLTALFGYGLYFQNGNVQTTYSSHYKGYAYPVRPVQEEYTAW